MSHEFRKYVITPDTIMSEDLATNDINEKRHPNIYKSQNTSYASARIKSCSGERLFGGVEMTDKIGVKAKLEGGGSSLKDAGNKIGNAKNAFNESVNKVTSPFEQKKQDLDSAMNKAEEPFNLLKAKQQQTKDAIEQAETKAEAAKKILNAKEILHKEGKDRANRVMNDAKSSAQKAKTSVEDRQNEFTKAGEFLKSLIAKLGSQEKIKSSTGGKI